MRESELIPGPKSSAEEIRELADLPRRVFGHAVGTCRMGVDRLAVVDPELRVHGILGSVPTVRFRRNAASVQLNIVLSFYGRKMQPIQSGAIILNTLLLRLTLKKMKPTPARAFLLSVN